MASSSPTHGPKRHFAGQPPDPRDASALVIADRLASLGTLVAGVAHEINNPITYVLGNLDDLERLASAMREAILTYRAWVETYSSSELEALAARLEGLLDRYGGDPDRLAQLYRRAIELELAFFQAAWDAHDGT